MFLNVAALPVLTITLRMNLMKLVTPHLVPKKSFEVTMASFIYTLFIVLPVVGLAMGKTVPTIILVLKEYIHFVVDITGGVCGTLIILVIPSLMVL